MSGTVEQMLAAERALRRRPTAPVTTASNAATVVVEQVAAVSSPNVQAVKVSLSKHVQARITSLKQQIGNIQSQMKDAVSLTQALTEIRRQLIEIRDIASTSPENDVIDSAFLKTFMIDSKNLIRDFNSILYNSQFDKGMIYTNTSGALMQIGPMFQLDFNGAFSAQKAVDYLSRMIGGADRALVDLKAAARGTMQKQLSNLSVEMQNVRSQSNALKTVADYAGYMQTQMKKNSSMAMNAHAAISPSSTLSIL